MEGVYLKDEPTNHYAQMNKALELYEICYPIKKEIIKSKKKGLISGNTFNELTENALQQGIINENQSDQLAEYAAIADEIINVDDFSQEEIDQIR